MFRILFYPFAGGIFVTILLTNTRGKCCLVLQVPINSEN